MAVDRPAFAAGGGRVLLVDRVAEVVPEPPVRMVADRHGDRRAGVLDVEAVGNIEAFVAEKLDAPTADTMSPTVKTVPLMGLAN